MEKNDGAGLIGHVASPIAESKPRPKMRYCPMCETYTTRRECKACGMPTESLTRKER